MRTTPLPQWEAMAAEFDDRVREAVGRIVRTTFPGDSYTPACVSTELGGLGIRRVVDHANGAFIASWCVGRRITEEDWVLPQSCGTVYKPQFTSCRD